MIAPPEWGALLPRQVSAITFASWGCARQAAPRCGEAGSRKYAIRSARDAPPAQVHLPNPGLGGLPPPWARGAARKKKLEERKDTIQFDAASSDLASIS